MFWRFGGYANISTIDNLLDKPDVTLEELLDESDLIQELKQHNTKLIEFLRDGNTLQRLLQYVVAPGPVVKEGDEEEEDQGQTTTNEKGKGKGKGKDLTIKTSSDTPKGDEEEEKAEKLRLKYAYVACEVLSSETWSILEALMANTTHLREFWDFLRRRPPLDPLQAGYFTKVNETLLEKKTEEMLHFFKSTPGTVPAMLRHVDCPMVMDLLLKIISLEKAEGGQGIVDWLQSQDLIPTLLYYLSPSSISSTQTSAGDFLKAIITVSANASQNEQSCIGPNSLTRQLVSEQCMKSLITSMLHGGNPLTVGVGIVIEVIRKNNSDYDPENGHNPDAPPTNHDPIYLGTLLRMFANHVPDFMELILSSKRTVTDGEKTRVVERGKLGSAWGTEIEPLGFDRFKTCELMAELLHCSNMGLLNERGGEEFIRQRDAERDRLRAAGAFTPRKEEDSTVDITEDSTGYTNGNASVVEASTEALRIANSSEEDGFEEVAAPEQNEESTIGEDSATSEDAFTEIQGRSKLDFGNDLVDEPLSPKVKNKVEEMENESEMGPPLEIRSSDPLSPTTANLEEKVRRVGLEDATMSSPPNERQDPSAEHFALTSRRSDRPSSPGPSPHPEDNPLPLFSKSVYPHQTPTSPGHQTATSATMCPPDQIDTSEFQPEGDSSVNMEHNTSSINSAIETDIDGKPVVGDYLKIMFVENKVVPTILGFFFRFPWNNFLHNVVYDVVQQVFNGPMERGYNRSVAINLFENRSITEQIVEGQRRSDEAQQKKNMRLGYMGHLTLVAEEVVKFSERHPAELLSQTVMEKVLEKSWVDYVEQTLSETRERDNAILGGVRPDMSVGPRQAVLNAVNASQAFGNSSALANVGLNGGGGGQHGLDSIELSNHGSASSAAFGSGSASLLSGFGSSSDDEDEEMDEAEDEDRSRAAALSTADTGVTENIDATIPLIPPPPAPLNIPPSRARRQLAARLALHKHRAEEAAARNSDDPFASLGDRDDDGDGGDPFTLDEEEEDITSSGRRDKKPHSPSDSRPVSSASRGLTSLFLTSSGGGGDGPGYEDGAMTTTGSGLVVDEVEQDSSDSDEEDGHHLLEATTSQERIPLETDDDEDEEMGEMVAPSEEADEEPEEDERSNSSDEQGEGEGEMLSSHERDQLRGSFVNAACTDGSAGTTTDLGGQDHQQHTPAHAPAHGEDDEYEEGEGLVEIAMPGNGGRR